ncbi:MULTISPECIES: hypothetical protein [Providencia]|uniref:Uncharacterized protein n=3 Tax=Providencia rettgeri TaxID=587 RepID=A0AB35L7M9_PRORE|nr:MULTISPECIES: hypothetical protein [Providencia]EJD6046168.1 hypothetical protein [Providencia rettgeri]EJD6476966.1 hypothetical protein [Providencia rettgeri]ELH9585082.1 hypothetical protein [Providencia rettgeri]ELM3938753.1 hypothetical protein [Providencia rettgeri]ELR5065322.1 hypothetical protein [Providencia rettgeri]
MKIKTSQSNSSTIQVPSTSTKKKSENIAVTAISINNNVKCCPVLIKENSNNLITNQSDKLQKTPEKTNNFNKISKLSTQITKLITTIHDINTEQFNPNDSSFFQNLSDKMIQLNNDLSDYKNKISS